MCPPRILLEANISVDCKNTKSESLQSNSILNTLTYHSMVPHTQGKNGGKYTSK